MTYKKKYEALQLAIQFEVKLLEERIEELNKKYEGVDAGQSVSIIHACDIGMRSAYEFELEAMKGWVK